MTPTFNSTHGLIPYDMDWYHLSWYPNWNQTLSLNEAPIYLLAWIELSADLCVFCVNPPPRPSNRAPRPNLDCFFSIYVFFGFLRFLFIFSLSMFVQCPSVDLLVSSRFAFTIICSASAAWGPRWRRDNECRAPHSLLVPALFDYAM